jgi:hypothetical protein
MTTYRPKMIVLVFSTLVLAFAPRVQIASSADAADPFPSRSVALRVKVLGQDYCAPTQGGSPKLRFILLFQFLNITKEAVVFNHIGIDDAAYVGRSIHSLQKGQYEPGSRLPDSLGMISGSPGWGDNNTSVNSGGILEVTAKNIWLRLSTVPGESELGVSPGKHFLQVFAGAVVSDNSHHEASTLLISDPIPFVVGRNPKLGACN